MTTRHALPWMRRARDSDSMTAAILHRENHEVDGSDEAALLRRLKIFTAGTFGDQRGQKLCKKDHGGPIWPSGTLR